MQNLFNLFHNFGKYSYIHKSSFDVFLFYVLCKYMFVIKHSMVTGCFIFLYSRIGRIITYLFKLIKFISGFS